MHSDLLSLDETPPLEDPGAVRRWHEPAPLETCLTQRLREAGYDGGHGGLPETGDAPPLERP